MEAVTEVGARLGVARACAAVGLPRASYYRRLHPGPARVVRARCSRGLSEEEREAVMAVLHEPRFADRAPGQVYATLLDEGQYLCSERTMYRVLAEHAEVRERRDQLRHPVYHRPELLATAPNQVWSWDITKLLGPAKWTYFYLYVILDIFSRYVPGWLLAREESAALAKLLIEESCERQGIMQDQLTMHSDRGPSMTSKSVALLLADLGVTKSLSRPHVSNDNPYSEAQFKTLKYRPEFPERFGAVQDGREFCRGFFTWYNTEHRHSGIGMMTPEVVHYGRAGEVRATRQRTLDVAYALHPERFVRRRPSAPEVPAMVWINPPVGKPTLWEASGTTISTVDDPEYPPKTGGTLLTRGCLLEKAVQ